MGQTLTHGIYLPDEGERNCYNGLAANWQLLDGAVGTVAEHTTALAGKAPAVHTHTKSDVTDLFNSANTWSALNSYSNGQIRIKSQNQEIGVIPSSGVIQYLEFADKNDAQHGIVGLWDYAGGASEIQMYISDKFKNGTKDPTGTSDSTFLSFGFKADGSKFLAFSGQVDNSVIPKSNNSYDLGSSSYQWNNVYASAFKGNADTASAFDTAKPITLTGAVTGTVSGTNSWEIPTILKSGSAVTGSVVTNPYFKIASWEVQPNKCFGAILQIQNKCYPHIAATLILSVRTKTDATFQMGYSLLSNAIGILPSNFILCYKEVTRKVLCELYYYTTTSFNGIRFSVISEGVGIQEGNSLFNTIVVYRDPTGIATLPSDYTAIQTTIGTYTQDFIPYSNNTYNLGSATNKWKSLNGINPGALSLPDTTREDPIDRTNWVYTYIAANVYYPPEDGWLVVACSGSDYMQIDGDAGWGITLSKGYDGFCTGIIPVKKNKRVQIRIRETSSGSVVVRRASFYPGTGDPSFTVS